MADYFTAISFLELTLMFYQAAMGLASSKCG
jgi:hypothetical protein